MARYCQTVKQWNEKDRHSRKVANTGKLILYSHWKCIRTSISWPEIWMAGKVTQMLKVSFIRKVNILEHNTAQVLLPMACGGHSQRRPCFLRNQIDAEEDTRHSVELDAHWLWFADCSLQLPCSSQTRQDCQPTCPTDGQQQGSIKYWTSTW